LGDGDHLGVGRRVVQLLALVVRLADDAALRRDDDGADGHLVLVGGEGGLLQRQFHVGDVERVPRVAQRQVERRELQADLTEGAKHRGTETKRREDRAQDKTMKKTLAAASPTLANNSSSSVFSVSLCLCG